MIVIFGSKLKSPWVISVRLSKPGKGFAKVEEHPAGPTSSELLSSESFYELFWFHDSNPIRPRPFMG